MSLFNEVAGAWVDGAVRALDAIRDGFGEAGDPPSATPFRVIYEGGKVRLRHYAARGAGPHVPVLLVYSLIKRPFVLDLMAGRSVVESLVGRGFDVYLIDWIAPTRADSWRGFDAYVNHDLAAAVRAARAHQGVAQIPILGYCMGALLALIYAALHPGDVKSLVTLTLPLDMSVRDIPMYNMADGISQRAVDLMLSTWGNCPAWFINRGFNAMAPAHHLLGKYVDLYRNRERRGFAAMFKLMERWISSDVALAGRIFRELTLDLNRRNSLVRGEFKVGGRLVDLKNVVAPVLNVIAEFDEVVAPRSSLPLVDLVGSADKRTIFFPTGHVGGAVSAAAHQKLWPQVGAWLRERAI